jgi:hypothetical protein
LERLDKIKDHISCNDLHEDSAGPTITRQS